MEEKLKIAKNRLLYLYSKLMDGKVIYKPQEAKLLGCSLRSIQRDIDDLRSFFSNQSEEIGMVHELVYDNKLKGYKLIPPSRTLLKNEEIFAVSKILLESRAFTKEELYPILDKLVECCVSKENNRHISDLIGNEKYHYIEPRHHDIFLEKMWNLSAAIREHKEVNINYKRAMDGKIVARIVQPVGIMFSEFYFYLVAFIADREKVRFEVENDPYPTIYRIDRIIDFEITTTHFKVPYQDRFEEGEFRKRVQFMYGGKLQKIKFIYKGSSVEAVLDRLPTAKILNKDESGYVITAEVFGKGIDMWMRSQGEMVEIIGNCVLGEDV